MAIIAITQKQVKKFKFMYIKIVANWKNCIRAHINTF